MREEWSVEAHNDLDEETNEEESNEPLVQKRSVLDVFDTHFHLDCASTKISGSPTAITIERWLGEKMERPPAVPVNGKGGLLIFCDPETCPETVPFDGKMKVAIGLHPKKIFGSSPQNTYFGFTHLITKFDQHQFQALRYTPVNRLLAETDSPYMPPRGRRVNTPIYVDELIESWQH
ncbi:tatD [Mytilus coruscus]|uniref:TatD n=1 Tax=Mytilus coruscus TaxID=42192 RepID=A0A6J8BYB2_MYTCO|nr:tatD [Mytilus coruscus]